MVADGDIGWKEAERHFVKLKCIMYKFIACLFSCVAMNDFGLFHHFHGIQFPIVSPTAFAH